MTLIIFWHVFTWQVDNLKIAAIKHSMKVVIVCCTFRPLLDVANSKCYCDNIFVKRSIPTVCFPHTGINPLTLHDLLMRGILYKIAINKAF